MKIGCLHPAAMRRKCLPEPAGTQVSNPRPRYDLGFDRREIQLTLPQDAFSINHS